MASGRAAGACGSTRRPCSAVEIVSDDVAVELSSFRAMVEAYGATVPVVASAIDVLAPQRPDHPAVAASMDLVTEALGTLEQNQRFTATILAAVTAADLWDGPGGHRSGPEAPLRIALQAVAAHRFVSDGDRAHNEQLIRILARRAVHDHTAAYRRAHGHLSAEQALAYDRALAAGAAPHGAWLLATVDPADLADVIRDDTRAEAGIDGDTWDPALGLSANRHAVHAVYEYYPALFQADPDMLWLGMASAAGPQFLAGFTDVAALHDAASGAEDLGGVWPLLPPPMQTAAKVADVSASVLADDLWLLETGFLSMQQQVFDDLGPQHYAYQVGGLALVTAYLAVDDRSADDEGRHRAIAAWTDFDDGEVAGPATAMLNREQIEIIQDDYEALWDHSPVTKAAVLFASSIATDPTGGDSFWAHRVRPEVTVYPTIPVPAPTEWPPVREVPLLPSPLTFDGLDPSANLANLEDRLSWVNEVVAQGVIDLAEDDPEALMALTQRPLEETTARYRWVPPPVTG